MISECFQKIRKLLEDNSIPYKHVYHVPTATSEESAKERGEDLSIGGKALVLKLDDTFRLLVLSASRKLDSRRVKEMFGANSIRFATSDELRTLTGLAPGSVPPFGRPILNLDLYVDESVMKSDKIAFNAGSLTDSIVMKTDDYLNLAHPTMGSFTGENPK